jgi:hypothetical protein
MGRAVHDNFPELDDPPADAFQPGFKDGLDKDGISVLIVKKLKGRVKI